ncbi:MAG: hypothetical protein IT168_08130, partial [Bryobacterales bacterium]|nr:hypothetical protein [Bryobacterales bacterium]
KGQRRQLAHTVDGGDQLDFGVTLGDLVDLLVQRMDLGSYGLDTVTGSAFVSSQFRSRGSSRPQI